LLVGGFIIYQGNKQVDYKLDDTVGSTIAGNTNAYLENNDSDREDKYENEIWNKKII
jgi:hypothetical protein